MDAKYPADRRFHRNHTWAKQVGPNRVQIGLDSFAISLIGSPNSVIFPAVDSKLVRNEPGCWILDESSPIPIRMPVSGRLVRANRRVLEQPSAIYSSPYEEGWLAEIYCEDATGELGHLLSSEEIQETSEKDRNRFQSMALKYLRKGSSQVGLTLPDGGERIYDLRRMLGPPRYRALVMTFL